MVEVGVSAVLDTRAAARSNGVRRQDAAKFDTKPDTFGQFVSQAAPGADNRPDIEKPQPRGRDKAESRSRRDTSSNSPPDEPRATDSDPSTKAADSAKDDTSAQIDAGETSSSSNADAAQAEAGAKDTDTKAKTDDTQPDQTQADQPAAPPPNPALLALAALLAAQAGDAGTGASAVDASGTAPISATGAAAAQGQAGLALGQTGLIAASDQGATDAANSNALPQVAGDEAGQDAKTDQTAPDVKTAELKAAPKPESAKGKDDPAKPTATADGVGQANPAQANAQTAINAADLLGQAAGANGHHLRVHAQADAASQTQAQPQATTPPPVVQDVQISRVPMEIGMRALDGMKRFEIRLDPAELGRVDVRLDISEDGSVKAHLSVDKVETLSLLQRDARTLERAFEQAGLKPSEGGIDLTLRDQTTSNGQGQQRGWSDGERQQNQPGLRGNAKGLTIEDAPEIKLAAKSWQDASGLDLRI
jgi:flagellar hook-length control protein FliK